MAIQTTFIKQLLKKTQYYTGSFLFLAFFPVLISCSTTPKACINQHCFEVELATTKEQRAQGLMNRGHLNKKSGMLFIFERDLFPTFWMKNTLIPLDIIWINAQNEIVHIHKNANPLDETLLKTPEKSRYVLEVNAGDSETFELKKGQSIHFKHF